MKKTIFQATLILSIFAFVPSFVSAQTETNPVENLILDTNTTTSLENVDFVMQLSPQIVEVNTVVDYYFQIKNNGNLAVENARMTHVLPRGIRFIGFGLDGANVSIETTHYTDDTLIVRGLFLAPNMEDFFVLHAQAVVEEISSEGVLSNQAVLDVVTSMGQDVIVSDAEPETTVTEEPTIIVVQNPSTPAPTQKQITSLNKQKVSQSKKKKINGSGLSGLRWAGMRRDEYLKPRATAAEIQAFNDKLNNGTPAKVKTYVDRSGKTKFYGITIGKLPVSRFNATVTPRPTYRGTRRTNTNQVKPQAETKPTQAQLIEARKEQYRLFFQSKRANTQR